MFSPTRPRLAVAALGASLACAATASAQVPPPTTPPVALPLSAAPQLETLDTGARGQIVRRARSQLGYMDHGHFCTRFGPCEVWCALFATWVWQRAGIPVGRLPFTGSIYDWAAASTYVLGPKQTPKPGDAVLFGTGPSSVGSSLHVGIVESIYPGFVITIEGDTQHAVHRFVVPLRKPQSVGEPGRIYAFASPLPRAFGARAKSSSAVRQTPRMSRAQLRRAIASQDASAAKLTPTDIRLRNTINRLRAFQHMPYRTSTGTAIDWYGVDALGRPQIAVTSTDTLAQAELTWQSFLARYKDNGAAYAVSFYTAQP